jgi:hypothetical protein
MIFSAHWYDYQNAGSKEDRFWISAQFAAFALK